MAGLSISFNDDYLSRYAGTANNGKAALDMQAAQLRVNQLTRTDAASARAESDDLRARSVFGTTEQELKSKDPLNTPGGSAYQYSRRLADIVTLVKGGKMEEAYGVFSTLEKDADRFRSAFVDRASVQGSNPFEQSLQASAQHMALRNYLGQGLVLPDGSETTVSQLFGDGKSYKKFQYDAVLRNNFSSEVADSYRSDDPFRRSIMQQIVEPVTRFSANTDSAPHPNRIQHTQIGEYVNGDFDAMRQELGDKGFSLLVADAVEKRAKTGTAIDMMDFVRDTVYAQRQADPKADPYQLVRKCIGQFDRQVQSTTVPGGPAVASDAAQRFVSKVMTAVAEESSGSVDFDNLAVRDAMTSLTNSVARFDRLRIPLLAETIEGGVNIRRAFADGIMAAQEGRDVSEDNVFRVAQDGLDLSVGLLSGGCTPTNAKGSSDPRVGQLDSSMTLGTTSGIPGVDNARMQMVSVLNRKYLLPREARRMRSDVALRDISNSSDRNALEEDWAKALSVSIGLSKDTARYVASTVANKMFSSDGSFVPVDVVDVMRSAAFSDEVRDANPAVARDLMRWFKASGVAENVLSRYDSDLVSVFSNPLVGQGLTNQFQLQSALSAAHQIGASLMEIGVNPDGAMQKIMRKGHWLETTGDWVGADGNQYTSAQISAMKRARNPIAEGARPAIVYREGDLDDAQMGELDAGHGFLQLPAMEPGSWSSNRAAFLERQKILNGIMKASQKMADSSDAEAVKAAGDPEGR